MKQLIVLLAVGVCLVAAQVPERCSSPQSWHARTMREEHRGEERTYFRGRIAYDELNQRFRIIAEETGEGNVTDSFAHYYFHKEGYEYRADFKTRQCFREPLKYPFRPFNISDKAMFIDRIEIGSNIDTGTGVEVEIWGGEDPVNYSEFYGVWTTKENDCLPIKDNYYNRQYSFSADSFFYNIERGYNPDDFVPPDFCNYPPPPGPPPK